jgi:predicted AlkP superfamily pyrophosphatase or phosphodiesterase
MIRRAWLNVCCAALIVVAGVPALVSWQAAPAPAAIPVDHVLLIGVDGLSPEAVRRTETPALRDLMATGAYTLHARAVIPTVSSPNWASMLMAAGPEQHGITTNQWERDRIDIPPVVTGTDDTIFPTIVGEVRRARPAASIAIFHDWDGFRRLVERNAATVVEHLQGPQRTVERAQVWFADVRPTLTIVHLDNVDHAGHEHGWLTPEYLAEVREADRLIAALVASLHERRLLDRTAIIISADHGGVGTKHGGLSRDEIEIPWIAAGAGIVRGRELQKPVTTTDTAATIARLLDVPPHPAWTGRPVGEALQLR